METREQLENVLHDLKENLAFMEQIRDNASYKSPYYTAIDVALGLVSMAVETLKDTLDDH